MSPPGQFPPELVGRVIDELGGAYRRHPSIPSGTSAYTALRACSLVSKKWIPRSRAHMFRKVKIREDKGQLTITPPAFVLPYVKKLEVDSSYQPRVEVSSIPDLLNAFAAAPIECLKITGGTLVDKRACIKEFIDAHSTTLRKIKFQHCSLSAHNITDVILDRRLVEILCLADCELENLPPGRLRITGKPASGQPPEPSGLELRISGGDPMEGPVPIVTIVSELPYRFSKLNVDHAATGEGAEEAANALIKANGNTLSSLYVHVLAEDMEVDIEPEHLFSLEACSNLSELTLDMERSESCAIQDSIFILSTLDPAQSNRLEKVVLVVEYASRWFDEHGPVWVKGEGDKDGGEDEVEKKVDWKGLDALLSTLAKSSISARRRRLAFILVVLDWHRNSTLRSTTRKWLPKLLPRFSELGLLHVHSGLKSPCVVVDDSSLCNDKPECLTWEGF